MRLKLLLFLSIFGLSLFLSSSVNACSCNCNYIWGASCGGLWGTSGCTFTAAEIDEIKNAAMADPGVAYTGVCSYIGDDGWYTCYYDFEAKPVNPYDGCACPTGTAPFCGLVGDCTGCGNPVYKYTSPCPTNTPTPTLSPTPVNQYPSCTSLVINPTGTPTNSYTQGDILNLTVTASDPNNNLSTTTFYYTTVQSDYCSPSPSWTLMGNGTKSGNVFTLSYNTTSMPYGDYIIAAKVGDSGVPSLYCTGNPSCIDQYNCCSQTNTTSCPNCRRQIEIKPACNPSFIMGSTSSCSSTSLTLSNLPSTHSLATSINPNNVMTGTVTGCDPVNTATGPITCSATSAGTFTWTHYYQDCIGGKCSNVCNKLYTGLTSYAPTPTCPLSSTICSVDPVDIFYGDAVTLTAHIQNVNPSLVISPIAPTVEGYTCTTRTTEFTPTLPAAITTISDSWVCGTPAPNPPYNFTYEYTYLSETCPGASTLCSCTLNPTPTVPPGYLRTSGGDVFIKGASDSSSEYIKQIRYPEPYSDFHQSLSTFNLSTSFGNSGSNIILNTLSGPCTYSDGAICSTRRYLLLDYGDSNGPMGTYDYLKGLIQSRAEKGSITLGTITDTVYNPTAADGYDAVIVTASSYNITAYSHCTNRVVFLIEGDLNITPDFKINNPNKDAACMFIVNGKTTIKDDSDENSGFYDIDGDGIPDPNTDQVRAFIVTNEFESELGTNDDTLAILGGLIISNNGNAGSLFNRNVNNNASRTIFPSRPSEYLVYEGARYIANLREILFSPLNASIVEPQFITVN